MPHLLIVDDDEDILSLLTAFFRKHGCEVSTAPDGAAMFAVLAAQAVDLVILDVMLHGEDGFSLCKRLRMESRVPVIMLTSMADPTDRVVGLEIGADDYLTKPFDQRELLARVKAVLRRVTERPGRDVAEGTRSVLCFGNWRLDISRRELRSAENALVLLSGGEFDVLLALAEHPQQVLTRDQLLDYIHGPAYDALDRSIDVQISRLRRKMEENPRNPTIIRTVRHEGYIFMQPVTRK